MRAWLYHWEEPKGKIFTDQGEYDRALADGWVEAPWLAVKPVLVREEPAPVVQEPVKKLDKPPQKRKPGRQPGFKVKKSGNKPNSK